MAGFVQYSGRVRRRWCVESAAAKSPSRFGHDSAKNGGIEAKRDGEHAATAAGDDGENDEIEIGSNCARFRAERTGNQVIASKHDDNRILGERRRVRGNRAQETEARAVVNVDSIFDRRLARIIHGPEKRRQCVA